MDDDDKLYALKRQNISKEEYESSCNSMNGSDPCLHPIGFSLWRCTSTDGLNVISNLLKAVILKD